MSRSQTDLATLLSFHYELNSIHISRTAGLPGWESNLLLASLSESWTDSWDKLYHLTDSSPVQYEDHSYQIYDVLTHKFTYQMSLLKSGTWCWVSQPKALIDWSSLVSLNLKSQKTSCFSAQMILN